MKKEKTIERLLATRVIAIIRGMDPEICVLLADAYLKGGIRLVEVTFDQTGDPQRTADAIRAIKERYGAEMSVGAGTVLTEAQLDCAVEAGAEFMVTPSVNPTLIRRANEAGLVTMPGALTPSEIVTAHEAGADYVKVFPVRALGAAYVKDVLAPLKHIQLLAVGGVSPDNAAEYRKAGCIGVGASGALVNKDWIAAGEFDKIAEVARRLIENCK